MADNGMDTRTMIADHADGYAPLVKLAYAAYRNDLAIYATTEVPPPWDELYCSYRLAWDSAIHALLAEIAKAVPDGR